MAQQSVGKAGGGASQRKAREPVDPFAVGGGFLNYCIKRGWVIREGQGNDASYYVTAEGKQELERFEISI
jgi:hypothetical protein